MVSKLFRDYFRGRRVAKHVNHNGWNFGFHGVQITLPHDLPVGIPNALLKNKYEAAEASLIESYLRPDLPVIELGGSLGVISAFIQSRLEPNTAHIIVEANSDIVAVCNANARAGRNTDGGTMPEVVNSALAYGVDEISFPVNQNVHANSIDAKADNYVIVPAITLAGLLAAHTIDGQYTLVCDIEGAEAAMIEHDAAALCDAHTVIMELHPAAYGAMQTDEASLKSKMSVLGFEIVAEQADVVAWQKVT